MKTHKITKKDGFIWKILTDKEALKFQREGTLELYDLMDNDSERLISNRSELLSVIKHGTVGIEVGKLEESQAVINKLELASELADAELNRLQLASFNIDPDKPMLFPNGVMNGEFYTEEAQETFNVLYEKYLDMISNKSIRLFKIK